MLAGTLLVSAAALGAAAPANAAEGDVSSGTLDWAVHTTWDTYILNPVWGPDGAISPIAPADFPVKTVTSAPTSDYDFPVESGSVTSTGSGTVESAGGIHWVMPAHGIELRFANIKVAVSGTHADIYADVIRDYTISMFGQPAGHAETDNVKIATSDAASIVLDGTEATITVPGNSIFGTADAVAAGFPYGVGGYNSSAWGETLTVSATVEGAPAATTPTISLSKSTALNPAGDTVHVTGTGFGPNVDGSFPPVAGHPAGFYVAFGKYVSPWQPSAGAPGANRKNGSGGSGLWWVVPQETYDFVALTYGPGGTNPNPGIFAQYVVLQADGSFQLDLTVAAVQGAITASTPGVYGVYTYGAAGGTGAEFETFTPLTFAESASDVVVDVPDWVEPTTGSFGWAFASATPANLGTATQEGANFVASGDLTEVVVTDTRTGGTTPYTWSVSGSVGSFTSGSSTFSGSLLGWTPTVVEGGDSVAEGAAVTSTQLGGTGLGASSVLASSTAAASARLGAELKLVIPGTTPPGDYTAKLTITAIS